MHIFTPISASYLFPDKKIHIFLIGSADIKGEGKGLDTCYSATYTSQTRDQQRFTISEVAADWHEPMVPQRANGQFDPRCS